MVDYADGLTSRKLGTGQEHTLVVVKPDGMQHVGAILDALLSQSLKITRLTMRRLSRADAQEFCSEHVGQPIFAKAVQSITDGPVLAVELLGSEAVAVVRRLLGPADVIQARKDDPGSLRARFGTDATRNALHAASSTAAADREAQFFFSTPTRGGRSALIKGTILCIIKPHAVSAQLTGRIIHDMQRHGFVITAAQVRGKRKERGDGGRGNEVKRYRQGRGTYGVSKS